MADLEHAYPMIKEQRENKLKESKMINTNDVEIKAQARENQTLYMILFAFAASLFLILRD